MTIKDKRLQIRVTVEELEGINRRARAAGLSVAEYGRSRLLADDEPVLTKQESLLTDAPEIDYLGPDPDDMDGESWGPLGIEDPGLSREEILEPESPEDVAERRRVMAEAGFPVSNWKPTIPSRDDGPNYTRADKDEDSPDPFLKNLTEHITKEIENPGVVSATESFTIPKEDYERMVAECDVKDLPSAVRCIKCGLIHGS